MALYQAENMTKNNEDFMIIYSNARSLCPKVNSFIECFNELDVQLAVITETWFGDSKGLDKDLDNLLHATGIATISRNRSPVGGVCY